MKKKIKLIFIIGAGISLALLGFLVWNLFDEEIAETPPFIDKDGNILENSVAKWDKVQIEGADQYLLIRGKNKDNPLLLWVHGGPGRPDLVMMREKNWQLEDNFIVVYWEQRGVGRSYNSSVFNEDLNLDTYKNDLLEVSDYLRKEYNKDKIYLAGHSWGSYLGIRAVSEKPEYYQAFMGIGQVTDMKTIEQNSYDLILEKAQKENNKKAIKAITNLKKPPYTEEDIDDLETLIIWEDKLGFYLKEGELYKQMQKAIMKSEEYTGEDKMNYVNGGRKTLEIIWPQLSKTDVTDEHQEFEIPVYFLVGRKDIIMNPGLIEEYYEEIEAPDKNIYFFEDSAHFPQYEESEKFQEVLNEIRLENEGIIKI